MHCEEHHSSFDDGIMETVVLTNGLWLEHVNAQNDGRDARNKFKKVGYDSQLEQSKH